jgi:hypothetical protein
VAVRKRNPVVADLGPEEVRARLPNLLVIGAAKCGTSALHSYLAAHPEVGMSARKELMFFGSHWATRGALPQYASHFPRDRRVRGESSPSYTMWPFVKDVPEQIAEFLGHPRFIYVVGDPVPRVVAHWAEQFVARRERRGLEESLSDVRDPLNPYLCTSRYGSQLERYLAHFADDAILVLDQADLRERRRETLERVFAFAGVDPAFDSPALQVELNSIESKVLLRDAVVPLGRWRRKLPAWWKERASRRPFSLVLGTPFERPELSPELRERIAEALQPDIERFRTLTGMAFSGWSV